MGAPRRRPTCGGASAAEGRRRNSLRADIRRSACAATPAATRACLAPYPAGTFGTSEPNANPLTLAVRSQRPSNTAWARLLTCSPLACLLARSQVLFPIGVGRGWPQALQSMADNPPDSRGASPRYRPLFSRHFFKTPVFTSVSRHSASAITPFANGWMPTRICQELVSERASHWNVRPPSLLHSQMCHALDAVVWLS
jgi:hypothetical protein